MRKEWHIALKIIFQNSIIEASFQQNTYSRIWLEGRKEFYQSQWANASSKQFSMVQLRIAT